MPTLAPMSSIPTLANPLRANSFIADVRISSRRLGDHDPPSAAVGPGPRRNRGTWAVIAAWVISASRRTNRSVGNSTL